MGLWTGAYVDDSAAALNRYLGWSGKPLHFLNAGIDYQNWTYFDSLYCATQWSAWPKVYDIPLTVPGTPLSAIAAGTFDQHFVNAANSLKTTMPMPDGNIYVRIGWEFNGGWYPWSAAGVEKDFVAAFRRVAKIFQAASPLYKISWDYSLTGVYTFCYPGDDVVDVIGVDVYHEPYDGADPQTAWNNKKWGDYGLQWQVDFARSHGKRCSLGEWGLDVDNLSPYVQSMFDWMNTHNYIWHLYWDTNAAYTGLLSDNSKPTIGALFKSLLPGSASTLTWDATRKQAGITLPNILTASHVSGTNQKGASANVITGKKHFAVIAGSTAGSMGIGIATDGFNVTDYYVGANNCGLAYYNNGQVAFGGTVIATYATWGVNDQISVEVDEPGKLIYFKKNGAAVNSAGLSFSSVTGANLVPAYNLNTVGVALTLSNGIVPSAGFTQL